MTSKGWNADIRLKHGKDDRHTPEMEALIEAYLKKHRATKCDADEAKNIWKVRQFEDLPDVPNAEPDGKKPNQDFSKLSAAGQLDVFQDTLADGTESRPPFQPEYVEYEWTTNELHPREFAPNPHAPENARFHYTLGGDQHGNLVGVMCVKTPVGVYPFRWEDNTDSNKSQRDERKYFEARDALRRRGKAVLSNTITTAALHMWPSFPGPYYDGTGGRG